MTDRINSRIIYLDVARGIAVWCVVMMHMCNIYNDDTFHRYMTSFILPTFFAISGMLLFYNRKWEKKDIKDLAISKAKAYLYPYATLSLMSAIIDGFYRGVTSAIKDIILTIVGIGISALWFLPALYLAEISFVVIMKKFRKYTGVATLFFILIPLTFSLLDFANIDNAILRFLLNIVNVVTHSMVACVWLFIGYGWAWLYKKYQFELPTRLVLFVVCLCVTLGLLKYDNSDLHNSVFGNPFVYYIAGLSGALMLLLFSEFIQGVAKPFVYSGVNSLLIFSTHLNFYIIYVGHYAVVKMGVTNGILDRVVSFTIVVIIEIILIEIVNRKRWLINFNQLMVKLRPSS